MSSRILIVEDDQRNLRLFKALLTANGFDILAATDGRQGVDQAMQEQPDLILMDIQLPVMNGFEAIRALRADARTAHIPIIAVTALAMKGDRERILESGCDGYVSKPMRFDEILSAIQEILAQPHRP